MRENLTTCLWNDGWSFWKSPLDTAYETMMESKEQFQEIEMPHDFLIYDANNLYEDCFGWYRKQFSLAKKEGEHYFLYFGGVYMNCTVYVNSVSVGDWKYGYSSFEMEITKAVCDGENEVIVLVRHQSPNSRWYSGAGIYRDVYFRTCQANYLPTDGTYVHITETQPDVFSMEVETECAGQDGATITYTLLDAEGKSVLEEMVPVTEGSSETTLMVQNPNRWDIASPYCYSLRVTLTVAGEMVDEDLITVGFKAFLLDPEKGFLLNGKIVKLHGVCEHHDLGALGAAVNRKALRRQFEILRTMGVNALRTSHNMPDQAFMELADEMGFVVMDEAFDMWERSKTTYDYARFFIEWSPIDVRSWVRRDRNHPSLILWSIGNEIYDTHADAHGQDITRYLTKYVREHDPKLNAPVTIASNYMAWEGAQNCADIVKLAGYNYGERYYEEHHKAHPDWVIYGSETASVVQSRGIYHFPLKQSILADEDEQCSALGNSATSWGAKSTSHCIVDDRDATYTFGQFLWTGFDYIGEPTPYHTKNSYFGQIDTAGYPKDPYYQFQAEWTDVEKAPMVHLYPYWDFNVGQLVDVCAVTNAEEVELFVNGESQGKQYIDHKHGTKLVASWVVPYVPGSIEAVAYHEGSEVAREARHSFGDSAAIRITSTDRTLEANGKDMAFLTIETVDEAGNLVENAVDYVKVTVEGEGRLVGLDNGDSTDYDQYKGNVRKLFSGKLLAMIATTGTPGDIVVTVEGKGLQSATMKLTSVNAGKAPCTVLENVSNKADLCTTLPARKIELVAEGEHVLTKECPSKVVSAIIHPANANDVTILWKVVNDAGIEVSYATVEPVPGQQNQVVLQAACDGAFRLRAMAQDHTGKITVISQLEFVVEGVGTCYLNPYELVTAGLFTDSYGEIGNGNEKGVSTARDTMSWFAFEKVDFGEYGSDTITLPVFALNDAQYPIEIWLGKPYTEGAELVDTVIYSKPMIWNEYQSMTYVLPKRLKGICTIGFVLQEKVHVKGFVFEMLDKAYGLLYGNDCDSVYGDSFEKKDERIDGIGNNVTIEYGHMEFGPEGATQVSFCGYTPLAVNTIHIRFHKEDGTSENRMVEFQGSTEESVQTFAMEPLTGSGRVDLVFLPGSNYNLHWLQFKK